MARRELKPWHYQVTTALASVTLLVVIAFFAQTFDGFFLTDEDPVLVAIERIKKKSEEAGTAETAPQTEEAQTATAARNGGEEEEQIGEEDSQN